MGSRSGDVESAKASDDDVVDAVALLVGELEDFAFERERVLAKLDIRAASTARRLGRELSLLLRGLPLAADEEAHDEIHDTLGCLLEEAHRILTPAEPAPPAAAAPSASAEVGGGHLEESEEAPLESGERPASRRPGEEPGGEEAALPLPKALADEDEPLAEETIARKVSWPRSSNRVLGR